MRDYLLDIVQHTYNLGSIDLCKITGTEDETVVEACAEDRSVIVQAKFLNPVPEFYGKFGMPNLGKLNTILNIPEYKEDAKITMNLQDRNGSVVPVGLHFENKVGDFKNDYRFMTAEIIDEKLKSIKFRGAKWNVDFEPQNANVQRLKFQATANSDETTFVAKTENKNLVFYFGDHSTHAGNLVFQHNVGGELSKPWAWPVSIVIGILSLPGDKTMKFSDEGASLITVNSGIAEYNYFIPAQTK